MRKWPTAKAFHLAAWLTLAPGNKISGGRVLEFEDPALLEPLRRSFCGLRLSMSAEPKPLSALSTVVLPARIGKAKAVTATARKLAVLF